MKSPVKGVYFETKKRPKFHTGKGGAGEEGLFRTAQVSRHVKDETRRQDQQKRRAPQQEKAAGQDKPAAKQGKFAKQEKQAKADKERQAERPRREKGNGRRGKVKNPVKILFLGGVGEIGKNMTAIECGNDIIIIDAGLTFPDEELPGSISSFPISATSCRTSRKCADFWSRTVTRTTWAA